MQIKKFLSILMLFALLLIIWFPVVGACLFTIILIYKKASKKEIIQKAFLAIILMSLFMLVDYSVDKKIKATIVATFVLLSVDFINKQFKGKNDA